MQFNTMHDRELISREPRNNGPASFCSIFPHTWQIGRQAGWLAGWLASRAEHKRHEQRMSDQLITDGVHCYRVIKPFLLGNTVYNGNTRLHIHLISNISMKEEYVGRLRLGVFDNDMLIKIRLPYYKIIHYPSINFLPANIDQPPIPKR